MSNASYKIICIVSVAYLLLVSLFMLWHRMWFSPDQFFAAAMVGALFLGRFREFIRDWISPIVVLLGYEYLHDLAPKLTGSAHFFSMIKFDKFLFGSVPTVTLQHWLFTGTVRWYDYLTTFLYVSHFIIPMVLGFIFWLFAKDSFKLYFLGLLILSYMAFITYALFPAAPPWMAAQKGILPPIADIMGRVFSPFPQSIQLPTVYRFFGANLVAAVPSLHAAYPWLTFLFVFRKVRFWGLALLPYVFGVWFSVIYLGQHYVFDIVVGWLYATAAYLLTTHYQILWQFLRKGVKENG